MDTLQLSRLYRHTKTLGLSDYLRQELVASIHTEAQDSAATDSASAPDTSSGQNWHVIKPYAWKFFNYIGTSEAAAQLVEHAQLYGSAEELYETMQRLNESSTEYYFSINEKTRADLVLSLWQKELTDVLRPFLQATPTPAPLCPIEYYFIFWQLHKTCDEASAFMFFQAHERELIEAADLYAAALALAKSYFYFVAGDLAVGLEFYPTARRLLNRIRPHDREYADALQLLLVTSQNGNAQPATNYITELENEPHWRERLKIIARCLQTVRQKTEQLNIEHVSLNAVLNQPLKWVPAIPGAFSGLSQLLGENLDLEPQIPSVTNLFRMNAGEFHLPTLDAALWSGPLKNKFKGYWHGVALLHEYVNQANADDAFLWNAKRFINAHYKSGNQSWGQLHAKVCAWIGKSLHIASANRELMLDQLQIAGSNPKFTPSAVDAFLQQTAKPSYEALKNLQEQARAQADLASEKKILFKMLGTTHPCNKDLERLWQVAAELNDFDLAWRVATIAESRHVLDPDIRQWWDKNPEDERELALQKLDANDVGICSIGLPNEEKKWWSAHIAEHTLLKQIANLNPHEQNLLAPSFVQILPRNAWTNVFVALFHKLGFDKLSTNDPAYDAAAKFAARLALLLLPKPVQALHSLRVMQAPLALIWSLEHWLLSDDYSAVRRKQRLYGKTPIIPALRKKLSKR